MLRWRKHHSVYTRHVFNDHGLARTGPMHGMPTRSLLHGRNCKPAMPTRELFTGHISDQIRRLYPVSSRILLPKYNVNRRMSVQHNVAPRIVRSRQLLMQPGIQVRGDQGRACRSHVANYHHRFRNTAPGVHQRRRRRRGRRSQSGYHCIGDIQATCGTKAAIGDRVCRNPHEHLWIQAHGQASACVAFSATPPSGPGTASTRVEREDRASP